MAATWKDMGARDNAPMHATAFCSSSNPVVPHKERINARPGTVPPGYERGAICRDAAVTAASLQSLQLYRELS